MIPKGHSFSEDLGVVCLACDGPLSLVPDYHPLLFRCVSGHLLTLENLLDHDFPKGPIESRELPWLALLTWEMRGRMLYRLAGSALRDGQILAAADIQEMADRIGRWVSSLRALLVKLSASTPSLR